MNHGMRITKHITAFLFCCIILVLGAATFLEQAHGNDYAAAIVYHTPWFVALWAALAACTLIVILKKHLFKRPCIFLLHLSFVIILAGGLTTFLTGKTGTIHLREGMTERHFYNKSTKENEILPFDIRLDSFCIKYYNGTSAPSNFISHVTFVSDRDTTYANISMNNTFTYQGFRFYQTSFDKDMHGSVLSINKDTWGTGITYTGYLLLAIAMLWTLAARYGEFRKLLKHPALRKSILMLVCILWLSPVHARSIATINIEKAEAAARMQVIYNNRIVPFDTPARDFVQKIYGKPSYKGLNAEQAVYGWLLSPENWKDEAFILIKDQRLRQQLGIMGNYATFAQLFDANGTYKLTQFFYEENASESQNSKSIRELDEKAGLIMMLVNGSLITPLPEGTTPLSDAKINAELCYNRIPFCKILFMSNLTLGILAFCWLLYRCIRPSKTKHDYLRNTFFCLLTIACIFHFAGYVLRWYIGGRIPLGNGHETMLFMSGAIMLTAICIQKKFPFMLPFGFILSGFTLLVAYISQKNPQITPLMPVLQSPLLSIHVSIIMVSYALLAFMMFNGIFACHLILHNKGNRYDQPIEQLTVLNRLMLYPAVFFLGAGIFLGAIWANISWGSYWSWDPKEVWALITFMIYGAAFHRHLALFRRDLGFHAYLVFAFLAVLMTYFGVNYFLGGMHSYA